MFIYCECLVVGVELPSDTFKALYRLSVVLKLTCDRQAVMSWSSRLCQRCSGQLSGMRVFVLNVCPRTRACAIMSDGATGGISS